MLMFNVARAMPFAVVGVAAYVYHKEVFYYFYSQPTTEVAPPTSQTLISWENYPTILCPRLGAE